MEPVDDEEPDGQHPQAQAATGLDRLTGVTITEVGGLDRSSGGHDDAVPTGSWSNTVRERPVTFAVLAGLLILFITSGVPFDLYTLVTLAVSVILIDAVTTGGIEKVGRILKDWAFVLLFLVIYENTRGIADTLGMPLQVESLVHADEVIGFGEVPTVWLQERMIGQQTAWWEVLTSFIYVSHFFASLALGFVLYQRSRDRWKSYMRRFLVLTYAGLVTYVLVPAAPPWYASDEGLIGPVDRVLMRGWGHIGLDAAGGFISAGQGGVNHVAALPSLHTGWACLFSLYLWRSAVRWRPVLAAYPVAMGFTLVYGGEHYVVDVLLGAVYAFAAHWSVSRWEARRESHRVPRVSSPVG